tara:strand:- start:101 stop:262 length:162 start_codon:yes stop_codon:yes gene_type:complete
MQQLDIYQIVLQTSLVVEVAVVLVLQMLLREVVVLELHQFLLQNKVQVCLLQK